MSQPPQKHSTLTPQSRGMTPAQKEQWIKDLEAALQKKGMDKPQAGYKVY